MLGLFVTFTAFEFHAQARGAPVFGEHPFAIAQRRVMTNVLPVTAFQDRTPMRFVVELEISDSLLHRFLM